MANKYYITTAIAYPNGKPHMGHALEIVQADCFARFNRLLGKDVVFQTGTDEHGIKNWTTAKKQGKDILEFLDANVTVFKELYKLLNISNDNFIRTSDKKLHYPGARALWKKLVEAGDIYKQKYSGLYCVGCESFKLERELIEGKCPNHPNGEIQTIEEENYFFKLAKYKDQIYDLIEKDEYKIIPKVRKNEILSFLKDAKDISFSRPKTSLPWGISVPGDEDHVMYVWCDALSNYITGQGYNYDEEKFNSVWPAQMHVIGKDILRFHAAFWPAMLLSAKIELPKQLFVHGFMNMQGQKMGKSTGNVVDPFNQIEKYGVDGFRFYLLGCMPIDGDGNYSEELVKERFNHELVANLSNFCYRSLSFTNSSYDSKISTVDKDDTVIKEVEEKINEVKISIENCDLKEALSKIMEISAIGNRYMQEKAPWKNKDKSQGVMTMCINIVKNLSILIEPFMPDFSAKLQTQLKVSNLSWNDIGFNLENHTIGKAEIIIRKFVEEKKAQVSEKREESNHPFAKINLKVAKVLEIEDHPEADRLYVLQIDVGDEKRQLVAGLREHYKKEDLLGKNIILVSNLKPAKLKGLKSQGMLLAATAGEKVTLISPMKSKPGDQVKIKGVVPKTKRIKIDDFFEVPLVVKNKKVVFGDEILITDSEEIIVDTDDGARVG